MRTRTKICIVCGIEFSYPIGKGNDRKHCSEECRKVYHIKCQKIRIESLPGCSVSGCSNKATRKGQGVCETHFYRMRRNGSYEVKPYKLKSTTKSGYVKLILRGHPLADSNNYVMEHRKVMHDTIGDGPHQCFWCGVLVDWTEAVIDHLNEHKDDNRIENLVYSCNDCNRARGALLPFISRMKSEAVPIFMRCVAEYRGNACV